MRLLEVPKFSLEDKVWEVGVDMGLDKSEKLAVTSAGNEYTCETREG